MISSKKVNLSLVDETYPFIFSEEKAVMDKIEQLKEAGVSKQTEDEKAFLKENADFKPTILNIAKSKTYKKELWLHGIKKEVFSNKLDSKDLDEVKVYMLETDVSTKNDLLFLASVVVSIENVSIEGAQYPLTKDKTKILSFLEWLSQQDSDYKNELTKQVQDNMNANSKALELEKKN